MKVYMRTYGCRANQYDTEALRSLLLASGAELSDDVTDADYAVFNSCTVTAAAEADLRADVRAAARANPRVRSVVMGCAAGVKQRDEGAAPLLTLPGVRAVIPGADLQGVSNALGIGAVSRNRVGSQTGARALLRIQDGCDEHCTFCATTLSRGASRSRTIAELVREATVLAENHPEIVITGIHIGTYGRDTGENLSSLVAALVAEVPRARFRLTSIEATEVDDRLAELLRTSRRLVPHLHAPLQSASNRILRRMGRHWYTAESYERRVRSIVPAHRPFALAADVIAGFPGESEEDHQATLAAVERMPFTSLHVFTYSPRPGTAAERLRPRVANDTARRRARELRGLAQKKAAQYAGSRIGGASDIVVIERGRGLTEDYLSVRVPDSLPRRTRFDATLKSASGGLTAIPTHQQND